LATTYPHNGLAPSSYSPCTAHQKKIQLCKLDSFIFTFGIIIDERARELYWEGYRRTDLIRFGKFTGGDYIWAWKGAIKEGKAVDAKFNLFPIPASDLGANPKLTPTPGY